MSSKQDIQVVDYLVSHETFTLKYDSKLDLYQTLPMPSEQDLPKYYESDAYISHTDAKQTFVERLYQMVKSYMLHAKIKLINRQVSTKGTLLDIGTGTGDFLKKAMQHQWQVSGVEPSKQARGLVQQKLTDSVRLYKTLDQVNDIAFDVITLWHVLEHVPDYNAYLSKIKTLLKDDGLLVIAVPNFKSYDAQYYKQYWSAYDVPRHLWHFSKTAMRDILKSHGFNITTIKPMYFDSFYVSLLSEEHKTSTKNLVKSFAIGLRSNLKGKQNGEYSSLIYLIKK